MNATQSNFTSTGEYTNEFDEFGNLIIVEGSDKYLSVILNPEVYEQQSLSSVYNIEIEEFKEVSSAPNQKVASLESEKTNLQKQISDLTTRLQSVNPSEKDTLINASRNVIVSLRIKAGEGSIPSDFNTAFPYLPLFSAAAKASDSSGINSSSTQQTTPSTQTTSSSTNVNQSTSDTSTSSTANVGTSVTQTLVEGDICPVQQDLQIIPPTDLVIKGPIPVFPTPITIVTPPPAPVQLPIHQMAVAAVAAPQTSCKELFYKYGKYDGVWESLGLQTSPMINTYGVYSEKVSETYDRETSDTLPYQVYIPTDGSYTIKFSVDNAGYIDMDGVKLIDLSDINSSSPYASQVEAYLGDHATTKTLTAGWKNVNLFYKNWGGPHSVAASIIYNGRVVWNSRMAYNAKDYQECSGNLSMTSYAAPTTPDGGGGGCPAVWQLMETKELGVVEARYITVGMHLKDSVPGVWNRVNVAYIDVAPIYRVDIDGQVFDVDHSHKWYLGNDQWVKVTDIKAGDFVKTTEGTNVKVNSVNYLRDDQYMHMNVDNQRYVMGTNIIGHNANQSFLAKKF